jgi:hypothetical protein
MRHESDVIMGLMRRVRGRIFKCHLALSMIPLEAYSGDAARCVFIVLQETAKTRKDITRH